MTLDGSIVREVVDNRELRQRYEFRLVSPMIDYRWDEGGWILKKVESMDIDIDDDGYPDDVDGCPLYPPGGPYRYAVEVAQGGLPDIGLTGAAALTPGTHSCAD